jgi:hypothetical protein
MNTDRKNFTGRLNSDIDERLFSLDKFRGDYSDAYNCLILSAIDSGIGLVKGFKGTTEVTTSYAVPNSKKVIGKCVDLPNYKIYYFVSCETSTSNHAIYEVDVQTRVVTQVIKSSILKFTDTMRITGANVVDGKYLLYTDTINEPRNIDIVRAKAGELTTELQILAAKQPPLEEPKDITPITDFTFGGNNIRGNFFQFKYRYIYKDKTKSTFSPISEISTMGNLFFPTIEQNSLFEQNNALSLKYLLPNNNIDFIEIAFRSGNSGDFALYDTINADSSKGYKKVAVQILKTSTEGVSIVFIIDESTSITKTTFVTTSLYAAALDLVNQFNSSASRPVAVASVDLNTNIIYFISNNEGDNFSIDLPSSENTQQITLLELPLVGNVYNEYLFNNNKPLVAINVIESNLEYDRVPLKAEAQELVNGSNVIYGGITEGYDLPSVKISTAINNTPIEFNSELNCTVDWSELAFFAINDPWYVNPATQLYYASSGTDFGAANIPIGGAPNLTKFVIDSFLSSNPNLRVYSPARGNVAILSSNSNTITGSVSVGGDDDAFEFIKYTRSGVSANFSGALLTDIMPVGTYLYAQIVFRNDNYFYSYVSKEGDTFDDCIAGLANDINNNIWGFVSYQVPTNHLAIKIYQSNQYKPEQQITVYVGISNYNVVNKNGLKNGDSYRYAIEYLDRTGKLSTVITNPLCDINVPFLPENGIPNAIIKVESRPPLWAEKFQILRSRRRRVSSFLQFTVNNVVITDKELLDVNFSNEASNLIDYNSLFGGKLSYTFAQGDRIRFIKYKNGTYFPSHEDLPILSISTTGALQIPVPKTFPVTSPYTELNGCIVEVYTPNTYGQTSVEQDLFYEVAMGGTIVNPGLATRCHEPDNKSGLDQAQSAEFPDTIPLIMYSVEGDVWYKTRQLLSPKVAPTNAIAIGEIDVMEAEYQSDRYPLISSNIGRANAYDKDVKQIFRKSTIYHSDSYFVDSDVNNINRVYATSFKDYDQTFGAIKLLHLDGFRLYNFQENKVGAIPVNRQMVYNQDGSSSLILSSSLLNNCTYFDYVGGINNNPESFAYNQFNKYFVDIKNNAVCKIGGNGIIKISDMSMKSYFTDMFNAYKDANLTLTTQKPRFYGAWDEDNNLYVLAPEALAQGEADPIYYPTIVFNEFASGWTSKVEFAPACIVGAFGELFAWSPSNAKMWRHNSSTTMNNFYGTQRVRSIEYVSAIAPETVKSYLNTTQEAAMLPADRYDGIYTGVDPSIWAVPFISTSLGQQSNLIVSDFEKMEGMYLSRFWRDTTTPVTDPLLNGDTLKGVWIKTTLTNGSTDDIGLYSTSVGFVVSK